MNYAAIVHRPTEEYIYPRGKTELVIQLKTAREDMDSVDLVYWPRYETDAAKRKSVQVPVTYRDKYCDTYRAVIRLEEISAYTRYCFRLTSGKEQIWLGNCGFFTEDAKTSSYFFEYLWPNAADGYSTPEWQREQVFYQIFPERFCSGDDKLTPPDAVPWGSPPTRECFMGGDIPGIIKKLDYIKDLGVTCLYLTPIFAAPSNHKYDTVDYYEIDPAFGTKDDFRTLVEAVHQRGLKIILDGVFNHCGYYWPYFQSVVKDGNASPYSDWFFPHSYPITLDPCNYDCVGHYKWMPKINLSNHETAEYFIRVGKYWLDTFGIDGWRLDVADEVPTSFWEAFSRELKRDHPDILLLGETWGDANRLVMGNRLDSAMNYLFRDAARFWLAEETIAPTEFDHLINRMLSLYPEEVMLRMYNPLDSHDTPRFRFLCKDVRKHPLAVALQMTLPGCPAVFYGDEVGLSGDNDPGCRMAMEWREEKQNKELLKWYQKLINIRNHSVSLQKGAYHTIAADDEKNVFSFVRSLPDEVTVVVINAGNKCAELSLKENQLSGEWTNLTGSEIPVSTEDGTRILKCAPFSAEIYQKKVKV